jgi:hypothetical protein
MGFAGGAALRARHSDKLPGRDGAAVASVPARAGTTLPLAVLLVFNIADVVTTHRILGLGGRELNPVAGWLLANGWLVVSKLVLVAVIAVLATLAPARRWIVSSLWLMTAFYGAIIAFHVIQLSA